MQLKQVKIAITLDNGDLAVMSFLTVGRGNVLPALAVWVDQGAGWWRREPADAAILDELARTFPEKDTEGNALPQPSRFRRISDADLPPDRTYRPAWRDTGSVIEHDMVRARALHLERVRGARAEKLAHLDADWMRATGQGKVAAAGAVESARQALRDLPETLDVEAATTTDELKAAWSPLLD